MDTRGTAARPGRNPGGLARISARGQWPQGATLLARLAAILLALVSSLTALADAPADPPTAQTAPAGRAPEDRSPIMVIRCDGRRLRVVPVRLHANDTARVRVGADEQTLRLAELISISEYLLRKRFVNPRIPAESIALGIRCRQIGLPKIAEREFATALRVNGRLADEVATARQTPVGTVRKLGTTPTTPPDGAGDEHKTVAAPTTRPADTPLAAKIRKLAVDWAEKSAKSVSRDVHGIETSHFLVFSAYPKAQDGAIRAIVEKLYTALCRQFDVPPAKGVWAGKLPLYLWATKEQFAAFATNVDGIARRSPGMLQAAGYNRQVGAFTYVVCGPAPTQTEQLALLVHETTHAFLGRYISDRFVTRWLNEGIAEYMAATLVPGCWASKNYVHQTRVALRDRRDISGVFDTVSLTPFDYGIATSLVRFLIAADRKRFVKLIKAIKSGDSDEKALKDSYGWTPQQLAQKWAAVAGQRLR